MTWTIGRLARPALFAAALATGLAGCAGDTNIVDDVGIMRTSSVGLTPAEAAELERVKRYAKMRAQALAGGAVVGSLIGAFVGSRSDNTAAGAGIGAVAGAQLGYMTGAYIARQNAVAEDRRDDLEIQLANAEDALNETRQAVAVNQDMVATERSKIARLNRQYAAGEITKSQYEAEYATTRTRLQIVEGAVAAAEADVTAVQYTMQQHQAAGKPTGEMAQTLADMQTEVATLRGERDALVAAIGTVPEEIS